MTLNLKVDDRDDRNRLDHTAQGVIGAPADRPDGVFKVSGTAKYAMDALPEGCRHGVLVRATIPAGRVAGFELESIMSLPGIRAVITDERLLRNPAQGQAGKAPVQGNRDAAYFGQPVALVVADTFEQARHGAQVLRLRFEAGQEVAVNPDDPVAPMETPEKKQKSQGDLERAMKDAAFAIDDS